jgi:molybdate transport system substrate-binding protein
MRHRPLLIIAFVAALAPVARAEEVTLYGAGSLKEVMADLTSTYAKAHGVAFKNEFGPSGVMRERIEKGEHVDIFASADMGHPLKLLHDGRASMVAFFTRNTLCATALSPLGLTQANFLDKLLDEKVKVGTSTPKADPAGDYTWAMFADTIRAGAFARLDAKAMQIYGGPSNNNPVDGKDPAVAALASGKVDLTIGYCSSARLRSGELPGLQTIEIPQELSVGPEYGLALLKDASPSAAAFSFFVLSTQGQETLARFGFKPVARPTTAN